MQGETEEKEGQQTTAHPMLQPAAVGWRWKQSPGQASKLSISESWESICTLSLDTFKITKVNNLNFRIQSQRSLFEAHVEKSRHAGRDGGHGGAADDCSSDVTAFRRRMALVTVAWASLKIVHFWASAISSGTKYFWIRVIGGQKCCCFNFGF